jgi:hypothetical protein
MKSEETLRPARLHFGLLMGLSFVALPLGYAVEQAFRWTDRWEGFLSGLLQGAMLGLPWCLIYVLPWGLAILGLYRWRGWVRFRSQWILAPSLLVFGVMLASLVLDPPMPATRFANFTKVSLPSDAGVLHYRFTGGGLIDYGDTYYFTTTPSEVERLIREMGLEEDRFYSSQGERYPGFSPLPGCPDYASWEGGSHFKGWDERQHWFYYLITDSTRTQVYVMVGCI